MPPPPLPSPTVGPWAACAPAMGFLQSASAGVAPGLGPSLVRPQPSKRVRQTLSFNNQRSAQRATRLGCFRRAPAAASTLRKSELDTAVAPNTPRVNGQCELSLPDTGMPQLDSASNRCNFPAPHFTRRPSPRPRPWPRSPLSLCSSSRFWPRSPPAVRRGFQTGSPRRPHRSRANPRVITIPPRS